MRAYVVTLLNLPESVAVARRCIASGERYGVEIHTRPGVWRDFALRELEAEGLRPGTWDQSWSNTPAVLGNFVAQYRIWREILDTGTPALILEHDAVIVAPLPVLAGAGRIVSLGKPSFGRLKPRQTPGFHPLFSTGDKIPGAHGYFVSTAGARELVDAAARDGAMPVDKFICPQRFPHIVEYWPWPIEAHDSFTTIQKEKGCLSKHNWGGDYRIM